MWISGDLCSVISPLLDSSSSWYSRCSLYPCGTVIRSVIPCFTVVSLSVAVLLHVSWRHHFLILGCSWLVFVPVYIILHSSFFILHSSCFLGYILLYWYLDRRCSHLSVYPFLWGGYSLIACSLSIYKSWTSDSLSLCSTYTTSTCFPMSFLYMGFYSFSPFLPSMLIYIFLLSFAR
jgi:hypothetical protein